MATLRFLGLFFVNKKSPAVMMLEINLYSRYVSPLPCGNIKAG
jgi:hypothetical protein